MGALENWYQYTDDDCRQLAEWQERFEAEQDELNRAAYRRYEFARWLVDHDVLGEFNIEETIDEH